MAQDVNNKDKSDNISINKDGALENTGGVKVPCPTCRGKKRIPDPKYRGQILFYSGLNGETCPHITCITCNGDGWIWVLFEHLNSILNKK